MAISAVPLSGTNKTIYRVESIDLLRGLIMIIMALDHVRDYFHAGAFIYEPTDLSQTNTILFFTRWITHFCAPVFMFLSGASAYLVGKRKGRQALAKFLLTRGLWLVFLELTVVNFGWYFNFLPSIDFLVIWALGISMIALAGFIYLPLPLVLTIGLIMVFGHNLLDNTHVHGDGALAVLWSLFHEARFFPFEKTVFVGYPIIPWIGVMALGYCLGQLYQKEVNALKRKKLLLWMGTAAIVLFIVIRYTNAYGDASPWSSQNSRSFTILSFLNVSKYPPSLLYLLVTLGPALLFLAFTENIRSWFAERIKIIGRVPMFYYLVHLYLIHLAALVATYFCNHTPGDMILTGWISYQPQLGGYGFSLGITYAVWLVMVVILYFLCRWYDRYKKNHQQWWLSYL
ncbi:MAG: heparan-alpha-glucosaminide N-acetyltransferase domain-containing protein [Bacteroidota bacterium]